MLDDGKSPIEVIDRILKMNGITQVDQIRSLDVCGLNLLKKDLRAAGPSTDDRGERRIYEAQCRALLVGVFGEPGPIKARRKKEVELGNQGRLW